jgi:hypothetical protein
MALVTAQARYDSPRVKARLVGLLWVLEGSAAVLGQFVVLSRLVVPDDAAATASRVLADPPRYWLGFAAALVAVVLHLAYTVLVYDLFRPVGRNSALLVTFVSVVACTLQAVVGLFYLVPMLLLGGDRYLSAIPLEQLQALALADLRLEAQAFNVYILFFGIFLILFGRLVVRSTFLPRVIGALLMIAGVGYATLLVPPFAASVYPWYRAPDVLAEPALVLWLLFVGVNVQRWNELAGNGTASGRADLSVHAGAS